MRKLLFAVSAAGIGMLAALPASAQRTPRCEQLQATIKSPSPSGGALATLEHTVAVLHASILMIDEPCGAPYIVSTDRDAIAQERARIYAAWQQARANCLQITSGTPSPESPCSADLD